MESRSSLDVKIRRERDAHFLGWAKIQLRNLSEERPVAETTNTELNPKVVASLVNKFSQEECKRLEPENTIPVLVDGGALDIALAISGWGRTDLLALGEPLHLDLGGSTVMILQGRHRIAAAKRFLGRFDAWWVVELYSTGQCAHSAIY